LLLLVKWNETNPFHSIKTITCTVQWIDIFFIWTELFRWDKLNEVTCVLPIKKVWREIIIGSFPFIKRKPDEGHFFNNNKIIEKKIWNKKKSISKKTSSNDWTLKPKVHCKPLNVIIFSQTQTDNINKMITIVNPLLK